jgi:hypothetical protein
MSPGRAPAPLRLMLRPSRRLGAALGCMHAVAAAVAVASLPHPALGAGIAVVMGAHAVWAFRRHVLLRDRHAVVSLVLRSDGTCAVFMRSGATLTCRVDADSYVAPALIVLLLRAERRRLSLPVILLPDSAAPALLRQLRARLRWQPALIDGGSQADASV